MQVSNAIGFSGASFWELALKTLVLGNNLPEKLY